MSNFTLNIIAFIILLLLALLCWRIANGNQKRLENLPDNAGKSIKLVLKHLIFYGYFLSAFLPLLLILLSIFGGSEATWMETIERFIIAAATPIPLILIAFVVYYVGRLIKKMGGSRRSSMTSIPRENENTTDSSLIQLSDGMSYYFQLMCLGACLFADFLFIASILLELAILIFYTGP